MPEKELPEEELPITPSESEHAPDILFGISCIIPKEKEHRATQPPGHRAGRECST